jgi:hypothetical protein
MRESVVPVPLELILWQEGGVDKSVMFKSLKGCPGEVGKGGVGS